MIQLDNDQDVLLMLETKGTISAVEVKASCHAMTLFKGL